jgi:hypothetical protein
LKTKLFLPPLISLAIAGTWLGNQRHSISSLEEQSRVLELAIASRNTNPLAENSPGTPSSATKPKKGEESLDWKKIAASFEEMERGGGMGDMRSQIKFQQRIQSMSKEDLIIALDEIAALDIAKKSRERLEQLLISSLGEKDPELALTRFVDRLQDEQSSISWSLAHTLQGWAKKDPASASEWLDRQIAAGKFESKSLDGKSSTRLRFEGNLINTLLSSDPHAAERRMASLPEDQRKETLSRSSQPLKEEDQIAFAELVRNQLPEKDQADALARRVSFMAGGDEAFVKVAEFLDRIKAKPAERIACVEEAAESQIQRISYQKKVTREDLNTMREWVTGQAPTSLGNVTGKALANATQNNNKMEYSEAAALAVEYNTATGNDDVLFTFLDDYTARQNKEEARVLAEKIADPKRREEILKQLK